MVVKAPIAAVYITDHPAVSSLTERSRMSGAMTITECTPQLAAAVKLSPVVDLR
jgi:hypothetical protein